MKPWAASVCAALIAFAIVLAFGLIAGRASAGPHVPQGYSNQHGCTPTPTPTTKPNGSITVTVTTSPGGSGR
jgi:hypothetical protein